MAHVKYDKELQSKNAIRNMEYIRNIEGRVGVWGARGGVRPRPGGELGRAARPGGGGVAEGGR